jgi:hypothetical protein
MLSFSSGGSTKNLDAFLDKMLDGDLFSPLDDIAQRGVDALRQATPKESGITADSWTYEIERSGSGVTVWWKNTHVVNGFNVAIGLQYGHGTGTGGWVEGYDYINPTLKPIFDQIADEIWKEVQQA